MAVDLIAALSEDDLERLAERLSPYLPEPPTTAVGPEAWLDHRALAEHFSVSVRTVATWRAGGAPHAMIGGRPKFLASEIERWLGLDRAEKLNQRQPVAQNGAAPLTRPAPGHQEDGPDASTEA
jgi:hypothetical protein